MIGVHGMIGKWDARKAAAAGRKRRRA
jgi:hypothetical protein